MDTRFRLRGTHHALGEIDLALPPGEHVLGRDPANGLALDAADISRRHAKLSVDANQVLVEDLGSTNGTYINGERITRAELTHGDRLRLGGVTLELTAAAVAETRRSATVIVATSEGALLGVPAVDRDATQLVQLGPGLDREPPSAGVRGVVASDVLAQPVISEEQLRQSGIPVETTTFAAAGGGLGSFVWADLLRVSGVPAQQIAVVGTEPAPYARYQRLCRNSQIPPHERLRSNSDSCPDNVWGFPGYATREMWASVRRGDGRLATRIAWQIFGEPALSQTYTPRSGDVFAAVDREAARIDWAGMLRFGRIRAIRRSAEGRLLIIASASTDTERRHVAVAANYVHLAIGYPAIQLLPDLASYREKYDDRRSVVNAYEEHDHIYDQLRSRGGTVVLRGRGIVASRIIQRLYEERRHNPRITVVHLHRSRLTAGHLYGRSRRMVENEFEFQPFNWPKGAWTGEHRATLERSAPPERELLLETWGGTTTADRRDWRRIVREGVRDGWYRPEYGVVESLTPRSEGGVVSHISNTLSGGGKLELPADFVIDCTGLVATPDRSPILDDLVSLYGLARNALGRLQVTNDFEVAGMRHGSARLYASGATTLGGPHAAVDSFLGLQYAAFRSVESMRTANPLWIRKLDGLYSLSQWWRWARGVAP